MLRDPPDSRLAVSLRARGLVNGRGRLGLRGARLRARNFEVQCEHGHTGGSWGKRRLPKQRGLLRTSRRRVEQGAQKQNGPSHDHAGGAVRDTSVALLGQPSHAREPATKNDLAEGAGKEEDRRAMHGFHNTRFAHDVK